ncbi:serine/threonine protein kinase [Saccharopolyspora karakumensis]|uniref:non-specific serine/threonine protein kinase n=1 Tax=Saccharopolyspora karakumensis TaxID=2530386 RepID=A0A4R5C3T1_9PSEU|nr:serine/threonine-protein kinase [Saccharopolyspora karakumensis]TDD92723.1 serine/threonine protein kinase [Saccharopolyspora karakumensis]
MSEIGTLLAGRYRLQRQLGSGGMGVVWLATDELLHRPVAVKQLHATHGMDPRAADEARQRAMREGRLAARLQHPNAIAVHDVTEHDGLPVLVMEYLPSRSLADVLAEQHRMAPDVVAVIGSQAAQALGAAHQAGIVHRDIKPGNVLLGDDGSVKITDFGISHAADDIAVTRTGILSGTPAYLAPEIARGSAPSPGSDMYSLGATLYTAVEGLPPSGEDTENSLALLHRVAAGVIRPTEHAGSLGPVLDRMLDTNPNQRPTPERLHAMLHAVASGQPLPAEFAAPLGDRTQVIGRIPGHTTTVVPPQGGHGTRLDSAPVAAWDESPERQRSTRATRRPLILAALAAVAILLIALATTRLSSEDPTPTSVARTASPAELERVVSDYYALLPQHPGNAWTRLGPQLRAQGHQTYDATWAQVTDVAVFSPPVATGNNTVHVGIELTQPDGTRIKEFHQLGLVADDSAPLINTDTVLHAETITPPPPPAPTPTRTKEQEGKGEEDKKGEDD